MKIKKIMLVALSVICFSSCANKNHVQLFLGETLNIKNKEYDLLLNRDLNRDINYEFASSLFYQRTLYNQLEKDAVNLTSKNKISSLLKNTDLIIFNIGNYELQ